MPTAVIAHPIRTAPTSALAAMFGEDRLADLVLGLGEKDRAGRIQQGGQQQVLQAPRVEQPDRVGHGDAGDDQVLAAFAGS